MYIAQYSKHVLKFKRPSGTSRGILYERPIWLLKISTQSNPSIFGVGECAPIEGLSIDPIQEMDNKLSELVASINEPSDIDLTDFPSIQFGLEMAIKDLDNGGQKKLFSNKFTNDEKPIVINGLIWMEEISNMRKQIKEKLKLGFNCIKLKIGALNFEDEYQLLKSLRKEFSENDLEIRVDANGSFEIKDVSSKLKRLYELGIHSIEQPIKTGQYDELKKICGDSPLAIALDEELILPRTKSEKHALLAYIKPKYLVFKPTLLGGFEATKEWIKIANSMQIDWWITSALESNIGLNAIAQFCGEFECNLPQGLGTGNLFVSNFKCPLKLNGELLTYSRNEKWGELIL